MVNLEKVLETYSLEEILEYNDIDIVEGYYCLDREFELVLPPVPVDA